MCFCFVYFGFLITSFPLPRLKQIDDIENTKNLFSKNSFAQCFRDMILKMNFQKQ